MFSRRLLIAVVQISVLAAALVPVIEAAPHRCLSSLLGLGCVCCRPTIEKLPSCCAKHVAAKTCCQRTSSAQGIGKNCVCKSRPAQPVSPVQSVRPELRQNELVAMVCDLAQSTLVSHRVGTVDHLIGPGHLLPGDSVQSRLCRWLI